MNELIKQLQETSDTLYAEYRKWRSSLNVNDDLVRKIYSAALEVENHIADIKKRQEPSPMMKQFYDLKTKHPNAMLLFRCGDFYETYGEDAREAARILGIVLNVQRGFVSLNGHEVAGFPYHALDTYLPKLIRAGKRVAICDQLEEPKTRKLVKRGITELVTPMTH